MKFEIDSSKISFNHRGIKDFFALINSVCDQYSLSYFVIGAFARDIILEHIFGQEGGLATKDIDIAIQLKSWDEYKLFTKELIDCHGFKQGRNAHEYVAPNGIITDIVPYGELEKNRSIIFPGYDREINMIGFQEVDAAAMEILIDGQVTTWIASIESIVMLKLFAWKDRQPSISSEKHVRDIALIIDAYYLSKVAEFAEEFSDLFDTDDFDERGVGARAIGRRIGQLSKGHEGLVVQLLEVLSMILPTADSSLFIRQFAVAKQLEVSYCEKVLKDFKQGFNESLA